MFPTISFGISTFKFAITLLILLIFLLLYGVTWQITILVLPIIMSIQAVLSLGGAILLASFVPFLPDLRPIISNGIMMLFFLSGIFFEVDRFPESIQKWLYLNPMLTLIDSYRAVLIRFEWPNWFRLGIIALFSILLLGLGLWCINRFSYTYPKVSQG